MNNRWLALTLAAVVCTGCGDPLVEGDYRGQPLIELGGTIRVNSEVSAENAERVRVALMWIGAEQQSSIAQGRSESEFPARYSLKVFKRPPSRAMTTFEDRQGLYAMARIVLYIDVDEDESIDVGEPVVGAAPDLLLTYFTSSEPTSLVQGDLRDGYQVMQLISCEERLTDKTMLRPAMSEVDLLLEAGIAKALTDLDCDQVSDDLCYDLLLQVQDDPTNDELISLYKSRCQVQSEPTFNNGLPSGGTQPPANSDGGDCPSGMFNMDGTCVDDTDPPEPDREPGDVQTACYPLLDDAIAVSHRMQQESYWRFAQCAGPFDPCTDLGWRGTEVGWMEYQQCIFNAFPDHYDMWCQELYDLLMGIGGDGNGEDFFFYRSEFERGQCQQGF